MPEEENNNRDDNSWKEYQKLVLSELKRLDKNITILDEKVDSIRQAELAQLNSEIKLLKYKSTLWGGIAGTIPALILVLIKLLGGG